ncbi:TetR/AcrR family transcriptional regulator [Thioclava sp. FR2]|uniref:TetR/AcrR family transcriptional regulator n=1 Tax=Thioclava sp. FR2 TaxID=3445780 RepID=UPI003EBF2AC5
MEKTDEQDSGWRGSRELWLGAAYEALIEQGVEAVKIQPLAARLRLSRTSFYWFFKDRSALLSALAEMWAERTTMPLIAACDAYAASKTEAMLNVIGCFLSDQAFDSRLEFATRGWALQDAELLRRVQEADQARLSSLTAMLVRWGHTQEDADVRARTIYLTQIGYISMQTREDTETRLLRVPHYVEIYTGQAPSAAEMDRCRARLMGQAVT